MTIADQISSVCVGNNIDRTADGDHRAGDGTDLFCVFCNLINVILVCKILIGSIYALGVGTLVTNIFDLGDIAADYGETDAVHQIFQNGVAAVCGSGSNRIKNDRMLDFVVLASHTQHGLLQKSAGVTHVDHAAVAACGDIGNFIRIICHSWRAAACQRHIGAVGCGDVVGNIVYNRSNCFDVVKDFFCLFCNIHDMFPF